MKNFKLYMLFTLMILSFTGCKIDDLKDDVNDLKDRVTLLEEQVKILNENVEVFAYVLNPDHKTIKSVVENNGVYTITLSNNEFLVLNMGSEGVVVEPTITINEDGFWVINGETTPNKAVGSEGSSLVPEFKVEGGKWMVRFGNDGEWQEVEGEYNIDNAGDKFFESAEIIGDMFVITAKDGSTKYELPIVKNLTCAIDRSGETDGYFVFDLGSKKEFDVTIEGEGEPLAPIYPEGWRAELIKKSEAGKYTLTVYAPNQQTSLSRATANNQEEIAVRVNKGVFWAVDKIKVKLSKVYNNNLDRFNDGILVVNDIAVTKKTLGITDNSQIKIIDANTSINESGVYFFKGNDITLTYDLGSNNKLDNVVILPYSEISRAKLSVSKQIYLNKNFITQNVDIEYNATSSYVLRLQQLDVNIVMDNCNISGMVAKSGFIMPNAVNEASINKLVVKNCNFNIIDTKESSTNLINNMDCEVFKFENNIVYRSVELTDGKNLNFKVLNANSRTVGELEFNNNTIVGLESTNTAMIYASKFGTININKNIFWNEEMKANSMFIRYGKNMEDSSLALGKDNIGYANKNFKIVFTDTGTGIVCPSTIVNEPLDFNKKDIFDIHDNSLFDTSKGIFIPNEAYRNYGAQR